MLQWWVGLRGGLTMPSIIWPGMDHLATGPGDLGDVTALDRFTIRPCDGREAGRLAELAARLFREAYGPTHPEPAMSDYVATSFSVPRLRADLADPHVRVLLVEDATGHPLGYAYLRESDGGLPPAVEGSPSVVPGFRPVVQAGRAVEIVRFYVDQGWHGRGVAQALMAACETEATRRGAGILWLAVWQLAPRAIAFYRKAGLSVVGTATFRFGDRLDDDYVMAKRVGGSPAHNAR